MVTRRYEATPGLRTEEREQGGTRSTGRGGAHSANALARGGTGQLREAITAFMQSHE